MAMLLRLSEPWRSFEITSEMHFTSCWSQGLLERYMKHRCMTGRMFVESPLWSSCDLGETTESYN